MSDASKGLGLYNTLTRTKEPFVPIDPLNVRMYVCGPTVYDFAHIGNARPAIVFDVLFRLLRHLYGESHVTYVRNITDVDDKINARALRDFGEAIAAGKLSLNDAIRKVTEKTADQYHKDVAALGCLQPTFEPRATEFVAPRADGKADMLSLISQLIERGHAYVAGGEVLFDTASMPDYGELSKRNLDEQQAGARVAVDAHKKNPGDFVLWKLSSPEEPGWESPWGRGRPGWHIECSAMSAAYLGEVFDIHGGGLDLIFPHHENEIAQSRCAHGTKVMANVWMHNGFLQVEGQKMSKSLGNFYSIHELLETETFGGRTWPGEVLRLAMLMTHYREPIDFSVRKLEEAENTLRKWKRAADLAPAAANDLPPEVVEALSDDLATYTAFQRLTQLAGEASEVGGDAGNGAAASLKAALAFLGFDVGAAKVDEVAVAKSIAKRLEFIAAKNWAEADRIRDELLAQGVQLKDGKDPVTGERVTTWEIKR
ncbi:cysteine--tRNA ligase [Mesorhizobium sp. M2D.F.Ca.ET.185.01.1.1]|uniref:cysteine--tRNA ligase n=1 Tax=unclassified Mesorhizobium TaxID=325217 RepID=UPI000FCACB36|nr:MULTISPECIES: cysteine--tRNA ligase [unclassified Mesorhizobium]TGP76428.1 cysteine--tRNA ligase [bacterium M00.F.Ca.ET.227.01.1.1]TGP92479.1 cysteine--tRNA ligase [bacterium M00.F.Ca.ET.222.01.1.1]TGP97034.1 cysteine--tRNA ligase [bacterium M00.F.Ca.ET.221.01.1.1]TGU06507.1 cysteine--tRNA ligase [bacterium M00.F.Ca.ET.163.01.1.1]TGU27869.1 cysteine--tRNA ligase [bacterium M00.F.Ca.ET.156.01.1.1]TGU50245.1 cysteine--tRNA ligase [bacterium M00.F.Ca.ET.146.01.1.1]TGV68207.1 cysteine--tRNA l